jgi:hypothetical protein
MLRPHDAVFVTRYGEYSFALYSGLPYHLVRTPEQSIGFEPRFSDPRVHLVSFRLVPSDVEAAARTASRVVLVHAAVSPFYNTMVLQVGAVLQREGFTLVKQENADGTWVSIWEPARTRAT